MEIDGPINLQGWQTKSLPSWSCGWKQVGLACQCFVLLFAWVGMIGFASSVVYHVSPEGGAIGTGVESGVSVVFTGNATANGTHVTVTQRHTLFAAPQVGSHGQHQCVMKHSSCGVSERRCHVNTNNLEIYTLRSSECLLNYAPTPVSGVCWKNDHSDQT